MENIRFHLYKWLKQTQRFTQRQAKRLTLYYVTLRHPMMPLPLTTQRARFPLTYPDDVFLVSYPRSGNTWMRFLIGNIMFPDKNISFANIENLLPDIYQHTPRKLARFPQPRIIKSHEYYSPVYNRVIYITRDPRDVCISYFYYLKKLQYLPPNIDLNEFITLFLSNSFELFGSWGHHIGSWLGARNTDRDFLWLRYEDLRDNPHSQMERVCDFLNLPTQHIANAIEKSSFPHLRQLEAQQSDAWVSTTGTRTDIRFIRSGQVGQWKDTLSPDMITQIEQTWRWQMHLAGYL